MSRGVFARGASELYLRASSHCVKNGPVNMIQINPNPFDLNEMFNLCSIVKDQEMTREGLESWSFKMFKLKNYTDNSTDKLKNHSICQPCYVRSVPNRRCGSVDLDGAIWRRRRACPCWTLSTALGFPG